MTTIQYYYRLNPILDINGVNESYSYYKTGTTLSILNSGTTNINKNIINKIEYNNISGLKISRYYIHFSGITLNDLQFDNNIPEFKGVRITLNSNNGNGINIYPFFDNTNNIWDVKDYYFLKSIPLNNTGIQQNVISYDNSDNYFDDALDNFKNNYNDNFYFGFRSFYDNVLIPYNLNYSATLITEPIIELLYEIILPNNITINDNDPNKYSNDITNIDEIISCNLKPQRLYTEKSLAFKYEWYKDGVNLNVNNYEYYATSNGLYTVKVSYINNLLTNNVIYFPDAIINVIIGGITPIKPNMNLNNFVYVDLLKELNVSGPGDYKFWYSDSELKNLLHIGDTYKPTITIVGDTKYYITSSYDGICQSEYTETNLEILEELTLDLSNIIKPLSPISDDGEISLNLNGGKKNYTVVISDGRIFDNININNITITGFTSKLYNIKLIDYYGRIVEQIIDMTNVSDISAEIVINTFKNYNSTNGNILISNITGGTSNSYRVLILSGNTSATTFTYYNNLVVNNLAIISISNVGYYTIYISNTGTSIPYSKNFQTFLFNKPNILICESDYTSITYFNKSDGILNLNVNGGTLPYKYKIFKNNILISTNNSIANLDEGVYKWEIYDKYGFKSNNDGLNSISGITTILNPSKISLVNLVQTNVSKNSSNDATISFSISGGSFNNLPYYKWILYNDQFYLSNNGTGAFINNLYSGEYTLKIIDGTFNEEIFNISITKDKILDITDNDNIENYLFYNKEGYPYNFEWDDINNKWNGKLFFDENGSDTYKTLGVYLFENIKEFDIKNNFDLIKWELYNTSGISFIKNWGYNNDLIQKIEISNFNPKFYTKWIYGDSFNLKYKQGSIITIKGIFQNYDTGERDFYGDNIFTVINTKNNAVLITSNTVNTAYTFKYDSNINRGYINSYNVISFSDYNQNISIIFSKLYTNKKLTINGTLLNDNVVTYNNSAITSSYIKSFNLYGIDVDKNIKITYDLLTTKPKIYTGDIKFYNSFYNFKYSSNVIYVKLISGLNSNIDIDKYIFFENNKSENLIDDSNNLYIYEKLKEEHINSALTITIYPNSQLDYFIKFISNNYNISINDNLILRNSNGKNHNNIIKVLDISYSGNYMLLKIDKKLYEEFNIKYDVNKILDDKQQNIFLVSYNNFTYNSNIILTGVSCFYASNNIELNSITTDTVKQTITNIKNKYSYLLDDNGINIYYKNKSLTEQLLIVETKYGFNKQYINNVKLFYNNIENTGVTYYSNINNITTKYYLMVNDQLQNETYTIGDDDKLNKFHNLLLTFTLVNNNDNYGFTIIFNNINYFIDYSINEQTTISNFILKYNSVFNKNGYNLSRTSNILKITSTNYNYSYNNTIKVLVNKLSSCIVNEDKNNNIIISGNYIKTIGSNNFFNYNFSTGMIIKLSGSSYINNNIEYNILNINPNYLDLSYQGLFITDLNKNLKLTIKEYIRKPRSNYYYDTYLKISWIQPYNKEIFYYDLSGENIIPYLNDNNYRYNGVLPLLNNNEINLNSEPNKDVNNISNPLSQQTVFSELKFNLERLNSLIDINFKPEPIQYYIGFNSKIEGIINNTMKIEKCDNIIITGYTTLIETIVCNSNTNSIKYNKNNFNFSNLFLTKDKNITIKLEDQSIDNKKVFNSWFTFTINKVDNNIIYLKNNFSIDDFTTSGSIFYFEIKVQPKEIANIVIYGQTEIEDERYKSMLKNFGVNLKQQDEWIFKESDINDDGIDYKLLNSKRKELLTVYPEIYNYISSYKALYNSINYFGYNDLKIFEYFRNINKKSPLYKKLFRVEIKDLFNPTIEGWDDDNYFKDKKVNDYIKTNLFNLTYDITDDEGNNVQTYTLDDVQYKLNLLKEWLRKNILPLSSNLKDITGVSKSFGLLYHNIDSSNNVKMDHSGSKVNGVSFNYTATKGFNNNYIININFYTTNGITPDTFNLKVITFIKNPNDNKLYPQQNYNMNKISLDSFNFIVNYVENENTDHFIYIETIVYNDFGFGYVNNTLYNYKNNQKYNFDERKNYIFVNNRLKYKETKSIQNHTNVWMIDKNDFYVINLTDLKIKS